MSRIAWETQQTGARLLDHRSALAFTRYSALSARSCSTYCRMKVSGWLSDGFSGVGGVVVSVDGVEPSEGPLCGSGGVLSVCLL
jgi:hypothetical protein